MRRQTAGRATRITRRRRGRAVIGLVLSMGIMSGALAACSGTEQLEFGDNDRIDPTRSSTTVDIDGGRGIIGGAGTIEEIQGIIDRLLASDDACAILTQKVVKGMKIDPTALASPEVFARLSAGLVQVFDHLIGITDPVLRQPLLIEKSALAQVLEVVNTYIDNPTDPKASVAIETIASAPEFVAASAEISKWAADNC